MTAPTAEERAALVQICANVGLDFAALSTDAHIALAAVVRLGQEYAEFIVSDTRAQMLAQLDKVDDADRAGYQLALRVLAEMEWLR